MARYARPSRRPRRHRAGWSPESLPASEPFLVCDCARASGHTADRQESRPWEQGPCWGCSATSFSHCCFPIGVCGPAISQATGPHAQRAWLHLHWSSSHESSSGLGRHSLAGWDLVIVQMSCVPSAGVTEGEAPFHCGPG